MSSQRHTTDKTALAPSGSITNVNPTGQAGPNDKIAIIPCGPWSVMCMQMLGKHVRLLDNYLLGPCEWMGSALN
jgi:hypothetical protein